MACDAYIIPHQGCIIDAMIKRRVNLRGIIFKNGKIFAQQLTPDFSGDSCDYWCTPGGGLEGYESIHDGLTREIIEETGITPKIGKLLFIQQFHDGEKQQFELFFHIENADDFEKIDLNNTSHGIVEVKNCEFVDPTNHEVLPAFLRKIDIQEYISNDKPVFISEIS
jgi:8-oxo-dGTP pyrophosphatase MutT (NUDIX family)